MVTGIDLYRSTNVSIWEYGEEADIEAPVATNVRFLRPKRSCASECLLTGEERTFEARSQRVRL